jgi:transposase
MPLARAKRVRVGPTKPETLAWAWLEEALQKVDGAWCADSEILNLPGWRSLKYYETAEDIIVIAVSVTKITASCPCGNPASTFQRWAYTAPSHVSDLPIRCKRTRIYFKQQRYRCACGKTFQQPVLGIDERHPITSRLVEYVQHEALNIFRTASDVGDFVGVNEQTVRNIRTYHTEQLEKNRCIETPLWLAMDEVNLGKNELCVISSPLLQEVVDLLPDNNAVTIKKWMLNNLDREKVQIVTMDMCVQYRAIVHRMLPNAVIVVDRYHVSNLLNVALKDVLEAVRSCMTQTAQREHMRDPKLLLTSRHKLSQQKKSKRGKKKADVEKVVDQWLEDVPDIAKPYRLKEEFSDILQLPDREEAERRTDAWLERVWEFVEYFRANYKTKMGGGWNDPFGNVLTTITQWRVSILNYIDYKDRFKFKVCNSFAEFANGRIRKAYLLGSSYDYEVLRSKIIYGGILVETRPPHPLDKTRAKRAGTGKQNKGEHRRANPKANIVRLNEVREGRDKTKNLLPNPQENIEWSRRFERRDLSNLNTELEVDEQNVEEIKQPQIEKEVQPPESNKRAPRRRSKYNPKQSKLF